MVLLKINKKSNLSFLEDGHAGAFGFDDFVATGNCIKRTIANFASEEIDGLSPTVFEGNVFTVKEVLLPFGIGI